MNKKILGNSMEGRLKTEVDSSRLVFFLVALLFYCKCNLFFAASSWSMEPPPVTLRAHPSLIPSGRQKESTVTIVSFIVSFVILLVIISGLMRFFIKRGCSSRSPGVAGAVAPQPEVELA